MPAVTPKKTVPATPRSVGPPWQPPATGGGSPFVLAQCDPAARPFSSGDKAADKARVAALAAELHDWQALFHADQRFKLLVVLQGTDTSGKDGTIRAVFKETSPLGVRAVGWQAPSRAERAHDFLWRIHQQAPRAGEIVVFNRSHYEDVLVPVVNGALDAQATARRYAHINDFERLLSETGTVILKFMLHISADEQRQRLQSRIDTPEKRWKFSPDDLSARRQWPAYQRAYEALLNATHTPWAPWTVVPADSKTHRNLMIATLVRDRLQALGLRYPPADPALQGLRIE
ncbi:polyphosphate--nucleotide phosphotransferase [Comamonadaceae bacterium OH2545_COT-014]|nr:polyphosphate--nucleotide phosphotransferase [Comamonadaceae bacterium OH2545_COT-014]